MHWPLATPSIHQQQRRPAALAAPTTALAASLQWLATQPVAPCVPRHETPVKRATTRSYSHFGRRFVLCHKPLHFGRKRRVGSAFLAQLVGQRGDLRAQRVAVVRLTIGGANQLFDTNNSNQRRASDIPSTVFAIRSHAVGHYHVQNWPNSTIEWQRLFQYAKNRFRPAKQKKQVILGVIGNCLILEWS